MNAPSPTRAAGLARLAAFAPHAGQAYFAGRNSDFGPEATGVASRLSPYLRYRLLLESEAVDAARSASGEASAKFVEEVFWRTYWKGFLEQHPSIWTAYRVELIAAGSRLAVESGLRQAFHAATEGRTGIAPFDAWARELVERNDLHNHARMWFASIWIFTLRLPWPLGADFFARHLLDGDPASNTLSWRWVAGLHTKGKPYIATAGNIARYTAGRFSPTGELDEAPEAIVEAVEHPAVPLAPADPAPSGDVVLLLHQDDLYPETLDLGDAQVRAVAGFSSVSGMARHGAAPAVAAFAAGALDDALGRAATHFNCPVEWVELRELAEWRRASTRQVVTAWAPVGPSAEALAELPMTRLRRPWDEVTWPYCRRGFFQLRAQIPHLVGRFSR